MGIEVRTQEVTQDTRLAQTKGAKHDDKQH